MKFVSLITLFLVSAVGLPTRAAEFGPVLDLAQALAGPCPLMMKMEAFDKTGLDSALYHLRVLEFKTLSKDKALEKLMSSLQEERAGVEDIIAFFDAYNPQATLNFYDQIARIKDLRIQYAKLGYSISYHRKGKIPFFGLFRLVPSMRKTVLKLPKNLPDTYETLSRFTAELAKTLINIQIQFSAISNVAKGPGEFARASVQDITELESHFYLLNENMKSLGLNAAQMPAVSPQRRGLSFWLVEIFTRYLPIPHFPLYMPYPFNATSKVEPNTRSNNLYLGQGEDVLRADVNYRTNLRLRSQWLFNNGLAVAALTMFVMTMPDRIDQISQLPDHIRGLNGIYQTVDFKKVGEPRSEKEFQRYRRRAQRQIKKAEEKAAKEAEEDPGLFGLGL